MIDPVAVAFALVWVASFVALIALVWRAARRPESPVDVWCASVDEELDNHRELVRRWDSGGWRN